MKTYCKPELNLISFQATDILSVSADNLFGWNNEWDV